MFANHDNVMASIKLSPYYQFNYYKKHIDNYNKMMKLDILLTKIKNTESLKIKKHFEKEKLKNENKNEIIEKEDLSSQKNDKNEKDKKTNIKYVKYKNSEDDTNTHRTQTSKNEIGFFDTVINIDPLFHRIKPLLTDISNDQLKELIVMLTDVLHELAGAKDDFTDEYIKLEGLKRCRFESITPLKYSTARNPYNYYVQCVAKTAYYPNLLKFFYMIAHMFNNFVEQHKIQDRCSDAFRKMTSKISDYVKDVMVIKDNDQACYLFCAIDGLSLLCGPNTYTKELILMLLHKWVVEEQELFDESHMRSFFDERMTYYCATMLNDLHTQNMTFEQYYNDPTKYGTNGGVSMSSSWFKNKIAKTGCADEYKFWMKTKNFAGLLCWKDGKDCSDLINADRRRCAVALKEEKKVRPVITTPMPPYIEQCYLLYILNYPKINATLVSQTPLKELRKRIYRTYICVDAKGFDNQFSKYMISSFYANLINKLNKARWKLGVIVDELIKICQRQIDDLDNIYLDYEGTKIKYKKGLLSGWRVTSLLGSMVSQIVCDWIMQDCKITGSVNVQQGDDIIICTDKIITDEQISASLDKIGLRVGTSHSVLQYGEFLRRYYSSHAILGLPCRVLKSIFYANPWVERSNYGSIIEITNTWQQFRSRFGLLFGYHRYIFDDMLADILKWDSTLDPKMLKNALHTPAFLGGLGVLEEYERERATIVEYQPVVFSNMKTDIPLFTFFGVGVKTKTSYKLVPIKVEPSDSIFLPFVDMALPKCPLMDMRMINGMQVLDDIFAGSVEKYREYIPDKMYEQKRLADIAQWMFGKIIISKPQSLYLELVDDKEIKSMTQNMSYFVLSRKYPTRYTRFRISCIVARYANSRPAYVASL